LTVRTGEGQDTVSLNRLRVGDDVLVDLGSQDDNLYMTDTIVGADDGNTTHNLDVFGQAGADDIIVYSTQSEVEVLVRGDVFINTGLTSEDDEVTLLHIHALDDLEVWTFGGGDDVLLQNCRVDDDLTVDTGDGNDEVEIFRASADAIFARMGVGNQDYLYVGRTTARTANLNGGAGNGDWLDLRSNLFTEEPDIFLFETIRELDDSAGG
jgi:hypothetical protein